MEHVVALVDTDEREAASAEDGATGAGPEAEMQGGMARMAAAEVAKALGAEWKEVAAAVGAVAAVAVRMAVAVAMDQSCTPLAP